MAIQRCSTEEEIKTALQEFQVEVFFDELDLVLDEFESVYEDPVAVTLANYMDALDSIVYEQCGDWVDYIDYVRYMKDLIENEENQFSLVKVNDGYCIVYQDMPETMEDDEGDDEEECEIDLPEM
jgi:hypothetical protein